MKVSYYPGCSLETTGKEFDFSSRSVSAALGLELEELEDWNCCGATSAHSLNRKLAKALPARNIALAQEKGLDLVAPCAACFGRLRQADYYLRYNDKFRKKIEEILQFNYEGKIQVMSLLEAIVKYVGLDEIAQKVVKPLRGLKLVSYYGCLMVRPLEVRGFDDVENPQVMDMLIQKLGGEALAWSYKTECCGASLSLTNPGVVKGAVERLAGGAKEAGAHAIVTACPLCQSNLEMRQAGEKDAIPSFYFTELIGLALGLSDTDKWLSKHLNNPLKALRYIS